MISFRSVAALALLCASLLLQSNALGVEAVWIGGPAGSWTEPTNWSTGVVPSQPLITNVTIDANPLQQTTVSLNQNQNVTISNLNVDATDSLLVGQGANLTGSAVTVGGTVDLAAASRLNINQSLWVQPSGRVNLTDTPTQAGAVLQFSFTPAWNFGLIEGAGSANFNSVVNAGTIRGNTPGQLLNVAIGNAANRNYGEMLAVDGGTLAIRGSNNSAVETVLQNYSGATSGVIQAKTGSTVTLTNITINGGEISSVAGNNSPFGRMELTNVILNGVRLEGEIAGSLIALQNFVDNNSILTPTTFLPFIKLNGSATLGGTGKIQLNGSSIMVSTGSSNQTLVNGATHTIAGWGTVGGGTMYRFVNRGLVQAEPMNPQTPAGLQMNLASSSMTAINSGIIRAKSGGMLTIAGTGSPSILLENFEGDDDGVIEAEAGGTIRFSGPVLIRGGVLRAIPSVIPEVPGGKVTTLGGSGSAILRDLRLEGTIGDNASSWHLNGDVVNAGILTGAQLYVDGVAALKGGGAVRMQPSSTVLSNSTVSSLTNEDNLIAGSGQINLTQFVLTNRGTVRADVASSGLQFFGNISGTAYSLVNSGRLEAIGGATLGGAITILNREGNIPGTIYAGGGSTVIAGGVTGGILSTEGTGEIQSGGSSSGLFDVVNQGRYRIRNTVSLAGVIQNDGAIVSDAQKAVLISGPYTELAGAGTFDSNNLTITVGLNGATMFIHGPQHTIRGTGTLNLSNSVFINQGAVTADAGIMTISIPDGSTMLQQGTLSALSGSVMEVWARRDTFDNEGTINVEGDFTARRLTSGSFALVNKPGASIGLRGTLHMNLLDDITLQATLWNQAGATLAGTGHLDLVAEPSSGVLRNSGLIRPEGESESLGRIYLDGDFVQDATGVLEMNLAGTAPGEFDALILEGSNAQLGGTLSISPLATLDPTVGQQFTLIDTQGGTVSGGFDTFNAPALSGRWWSLDYQSDKVILSVQAITADFNLDGVVDGLDLAAWQLAYAAGNSAADAEGDGDSDGRDYLAWQRQFGSGIAPEGLIANVPEPSEMTLLAFVVISAVRRKLA